MGWRVRGWNPLVSSCRDQGSPEQGEKLKGESEAWETGIELRPLCGGLPRGPVSSHVAPESEPKLSGVLSPALFPPLKDRVSLYSSGWPEFHYCSSDWS